jgi:Leucine-rich repeat (LRR) protein
MTALRYLSLEGNRIRRLPDEAFQNLHYLSRLNLAFNELEILDFAAFDSIGTLSHLTIDLSHNALQVRLTQPLCFYDYFMHILQYLSFKICSFF